MTSKAQDFLVALHALCYQHQVVLYVGGDYDDPHLILADLEAGESPVSFDEVEDLTTSASQPLTREEDVRP